MEDRVGDVPLTSAEMGLDVTGGVRTTVTKLWESVS